MVTCFRSLKEIFSAHIATSLYGQALRVDLGRIFKLPDFDKDEVITQLENIKQQIKVELPEARCNSVQIKNKLSIAIIDVKVKILEITAVKEFLSEKVASDSAGNQGKNHSFHFNVTRYLTAQDTVLA
jgi:hypothetical protein